MRTGFYLFNAKKPLKKHFRRSKGVNFSRISQVLQNHGRCHLKAFRNFGDHLIITLNLKLAYIWIETSYSSITLSWKQTSPQADFHFSKIFHRFQWLFISNTVWPTHCKTFVKNQWRNGVLKCSVRKNFFFLTITFIIAS